MKKLSIFVVLFALLAGVLVANAQVLNPTAVDFVVEPLVPLFLERIVHEDYAPAVEDYLYTRAFETYVNPAAPTAAEITTAAPYVLEYWLRYADEYFIQDALAELAARAAAPAVINVTVPYTVETEAEALDFLDLAATLINLNIVAADAATPLPSVWRYNSADVNGWLQEFSAAYAADSYSALAVPYAAGYALQDLLALNGSYFNYAIDHNVIVNWP